MQRQTPPKRPIKCGILGPRGLDPRENLARRFFRDPQGFPPVNFLDCLEEGRGTILVEYLLDNILLAFVVSNLADTGGTTGIVCRFQIFVGRTAGDQRVPQRHDLCFKGQGLMVHCDFNFVHDLYLISQL